MANYNLAQGGDVHYNENYALYPQNAFVDGRPEFGWSETLLKPAHHWEGGHYAPVRHLNFRENCECNLSRISKEFVVGDTFLTHIIPSMSLLTDFHYVVHTPVEGVTFDVVLASTAAEETPVVIGTIDAGVEGDNWFVIDGGHYVPSTTNEGIEFVITGWPEEEEPTQPEDPCGVFGDCPTSLSLCFTSTAFYKHARAEKYCEQYCYDSCGC